MYHKSSKPIKMWIDGECFQIKQLSKQPKISLAAISPADTNAERKLSTKFRLPNKYYMKLNYFPSFDLKTLQNTTNTRITFPKHGKNGLLEIRGESEKALQDAREELHTILAQIREQQRAIQFIGIPLVNDEIQKNFEEFKSKVLAEENITGLEESIFQSSLKLHITVIVFCLLDINEKNEAVKALEDCKNTILKPFLEGISPKIKVSGLNCMQDNLKKANVLYANAQLVDETQELNLQKIANAISDFFYDRGFVKDYADNVKLHMTLMNTKYRESTSLSSRKKWVKRKPFDATKIIEKYKDYYFGECEFNSLHLSLMDTIGEDGFYKPLATIAF